MANESKYAPDKHHRRSIRLKGYDYAQPGAYFVIICTQNRECFFGEIIDGRTEFNAAGKMVVKWYHELENKFPDIKCDEFVCMPNPVHFILINVGTVGTDPRVCPNETGEQTGAKGEQTGGKNEHVGSMGGHIDSTGGQNAEQTGGHTGPPLPRVIQWFKTMTTNEYIKNVKNNNWQPFDKKLWQRNYYEHIIRDEKGLTRIREYICRNPENWEYDKNHKKS